MLDSFKSGKISFPEFLTLVSNEISATLQQSTDGLLETVKMMRQINDLMGGDLYE